ncbi:uncharacterized protein LOC118193298 [Stegodyphus dumicola]|uniref:uncharacterized protein LOC118193298 n=1 Tax=Stegodyphus dumicola TaxID=202533 RepID=UPI0015B0E580|nr:uncharacterized protein LOC118193298 [Stegodyphus dumicola]
MNISVRLDHNNCCNERSSVSDLSDPQVPASFGGVAALHRALKGRVKTKDIQKWLQTKDSYTLHKPLRHKFPRNRVIVGGLNEQFQSDLVDMQSLASFNDGYKYLLTCIDILSKYAWAIPLKDKTSVSIQSAFEKIFSERTPESLQTDAGKEFTNKHVQNFLKKRNVHFFTTHNATKASVVERFNRTLKTKMWKYFTEMNTRRYIDVIDKLISSYNHTWHRSIKTEPVSVTLQNQERIWKTLYGQQPSTKPCFFRFKDWRYGTHQPRKKWLFEKGYEQNWTREIFTIYKIIRRIPVVYKLKDLAGEVIQGTFYKQELQKVSDSGYYPVEKVLKKRKRRGKVEYFVKFQGYPESFNAWVDDVRRV